MSNSVRDRISADFESIKNTGKDRFSRIREIVRDAVAQSAGEVKEGSGEIRSIVKDAVFAVLNLSKSQGAKVSDDVKASLEGAIEGIRDARPNEIADAEAETTQLQTELTEQKVITPVETDGSIIVVEATDSTYSKSWRSLLKDLLLALKDWSWAELKQVFAKGKTQLNDLDTDLENRYGDRYRTVKATAQRAKASYEYAKAGDTTVVDDAYGQASDRASQAGKAAAQAEQTARRTLKTVLQKAAEKL